MLTTIDEVTQNIRKTDPYEMDGRQDPDPFLGHDEDAARNCQPSFSGSEPINGRQKIALQHDLGREHEIADEPRFGAMVLWQSQCDRIAMTQNDAER